MLEQISTQLLAGILATPKMFEAFDNDIENIKQLAVTTAIEYAKELKRQLENEKSNNDEIIID